MTEVTTKKAGKKPAAKKRASSLTPKQKAEAIALWRAGEATYEQLMARFGVKSKTTFQRLFAKEGVRHGDGAKEVQQQVVAQVQKQLVDEVSIVAKRIKDTKEEHYNLSTAIAKLTGRLIMKAAQNQTTLAANKEELKALNLAILNLKLAREERFAVNDYIPGEKHDEDTLPELGIHELTQEQIIEMAKSRGDEEDFERGLAELEAEMPSAGPEGGGDGAA